MESSSHFIFDCIEYKESRSIYMEDIIQILDEESVVKWINLSVNDRLKSILFPFNDFITLRIQKRNKSSMYYINKRLIVINLLLDYVINTKHELGMVWLVYIIVSFVLI